MCSAPKRLTALCRARPNDQPGDLDTWHKFTKHVGFKKFQQRKASAQPTSTPEYTRQHPTRMCLHESFPVLENNPSFIFAGIFPTRMWLWVSSFDGRKQRQSVKGRISEQKSHANAKATKQKVRRNHSYQRYAQYCGAKRVRETLFYGAFKREFCLMGQITTLRGWQSKPP